MTLLTTDVQQLAAYAILFKLGVQALDKILSAPAIDAFTDAFPGDGDNKAVAAARKFVALLASFAALLNVSKK